MRTSFSQIHSEIKEEGSGAGEQLSSATDFPRQFPSPGYSYYTRSQEYCVTQEAGDKDMETRYYRSYFYTDSAEYLFYASISLDRV